MTTASPADSTVQNAQSGLARLRAAFNHGRTRPLEWRFQQLDALSRFITEQENRIIDALRSDLGKPALEAYVAEIAYCQSEIRLMRKHLKAWTAPEKVPTPLIWQPGRSRICREPLGVVLIIAPWNYPFQLLIAPLTGAIAAGNCVLAKPSEIAPATSRLLAEELPRYLDPDTVHVVEGGVDETTALLNNRFDHIFYTGNGEVGRVILQAAAKHLTPVTLELGGKCPCIVDQDADLDVAARRILWGKFYNAGQTCVAPDYVLAHEAIESRLIEKMRTVLISFYGDDPQKSSDFGRIVNARHHRRLCRLLAGGEVAAGGVTDEQSLYFAPTILRKVAADAPVMSEEVFGPILPVLTFKTTDDAVAFVNERPKPLALYVFADDTRRALSIIERTSSGGATVNHTWVHLAVPSLPFGGVGESGMGAYHGRASFETFSHKKSLLLKPTFPDPAILYPPYDEGKRRWLRRLL
jgi:aldehyde dehydrogenase (NAD+)